MLANVATSGSDGKVDLSVAAGTAPSPATLNGVSMDNPVAGTGTDTYLGTGLATLASLGTPGHSAMYTMDISTEAATVSDVAYPATFVGSVGVRLTG